MGLSRRLMGCCEHPWSCAKRPPVMTARLHRRRPAMPRVIAMARGSRAVRAVVAIGRPRAEGWADRSGSGRTIRIHA